MGLDVLPKAGISFKANSGVGNFRKKLDKLTRYQGGEFGMLRNNRSAIEAAISKRAETIRVKGGLDRLQRKSALLEIMKNDKTLTKADKYKVKELLDYYSRDKKGAAPAGAAATTVEKDETPALEPRRPDFTHVMNDGFFHSGPAAAPAAGESPAKHSPFGRSSLSRPNQKIPGRLGPLPGGEEEPKNPYLHSAGGGRGGSLSPLN